MARFNFSLLVFLSLMVASMQFDSTVAQTRHVVGDTLGWTIAPGGETAYTTWASLQTFTVGDILVFNFNNGAHDVAEVSATSYGPCNATDPISLATTGPATLTLTTAGSHYYICTFSSHCQLGQKLAINVSASAIASPPSATPATPASPPTVTATPPSATPTTPAELPCPPPSSPSSSPTSPPTITSGNTISPPPPSSAAPSFTALVPASFLAIVLAILNH